MKRRELIRRGVFAGAVAALRPGLGMTHSGTQAAGTAGSSELTPAQSGVDASKDLAAAGWKPLVCACASLIDRFRRSEI